MFKNSIFKTWFISVLILFVFTDQTYSARITITTSPTTAEIWDNGRLMGSGTYTFSTPRRGAYDHLIEIKAPGYIDRSIRCTNTSPCNSSLYLPLTADPVYTSTTQSDWLNKDNTLNVKAERTPEQAWKIIVATILDKFDVLESNDIRSGYLRTSWVGTTYSTNTIRVRVIVKMSTEDPLVYKFKFVSEQSGMYGTSFSSDNLFRPYERIQKKYDGFLEELMTKLRN